MLLPIGLDSVGTLRRPDGKSNGAARDPILVVLDPNPIGGRCS